MKFVDSLPTASRTSEVKQQLTDIVDILKTQPGRWALVFDADDKLSPQTASNRVAALKQFDGVDATSRTVDGMGTVYATYTA